MEVIFIRLKKINNGKHTVEKSVRFIWYLRFGYINVFNGVEMFWILFQCLITRDRRKCLCVFLSRFLLCFLLVTLSFSR